MKPVVITIEGLGRSSGLPALLPSDLERICLPLPGWEGPALPRYGPTDLADALDLQLPVRPVILVGVSLGGSIALAMRSPRIVSVVALDPPLHPAHAAPLMAQVRSKLQPARPDLSQFFSEALGVFPVRTPAHAHAVVGSVMQVPDVMPSLCSAADRSRLRAAGVALHLAQAGHDVVRADPDLVREVIAQAAAFRMTM